MTFFAFISFGASCNKVGTSLAGFAPAGYGHFWRLTAATAVSDWAGALCAILIDSKPFIAFKANGGRLFKQCGRAFFTAWNTFAVLHCHTFLAGFAVLIRSVFCAAGADSVARFALSSVESLAGFADWNASVLRTFTG
jgi:hypothetical protein